MDKEKRNYCVYKHISPSNKIYIGITNNVKKRWGSNGIGYKYNTYFYNAIKKYSWDNFKHEILYDNLTKEEACKKEKELIKEYNTTNRDVGYNISFGGEAFFEGKVHTQETKDKISNALKGVNTGEKNFWYGKPSPKRGYKYPKEHNEKISKILKEKYKNEGLPKKVIEYINNNTRKINQYDLDGNLIRTWNSYYEIKNEFNENIDKSVIYRCCIRKSYDNDSRRILSYLGYQWRFTDDCEDISQYKRRKQNYSVIEKPIYEINNNGDIIGEYKSIKQCADILNLNSSMISAVCNGRYATTKGHMFIYISEYNKDNINKHLLKKNNRVFASCQKVCEIDENGNILKIYKSIRECAKDVGVKSESQISGVCNGRLKTAKGRLFRYYSE